MTWILFLFGSGAAFFVGVAIVMLCVAAFACFRGSRLRRLATVATLAGLGLIVASATPLPYELYAIAIGLTLLGLIAERLADSKAQAATVSQKAFRLLTFASWLVAAGLEVPFLLVPRALPFAEPPTLYILGDSVAAGMGGEKTTWPKILAEERSIKVVDLSRPGATARSAVKQADNIGAGSALVLLEIGGNDMLGSTSTEQFDDDLEELLSKVARPNRKLVMFELPLPPLRNAFGQSQRRLAREHGVRLIPKHVFASILTGEEATLDSVHLSEAGHRRMADAVWRIIGPAFRD